MSKVKQDYYDDSGHLVHFRSDGSKSVSLSFDGDSGKTEQSHLAPTSIEYLLKQHSLNPAKMFIPESDFQDFTRMPSTRQDCLNFIIESEELFESLPLEARKAFGHDMGRFLAAIDDPTQRGRLVELGVFKPTEGASEVVSGKDSSVGTPPVGGQGGSSDK